MLRQIQMFKLYIEIICLGKEPFFSPNTSASSVKMMMNFCLFYSLLNPIPSEYELMLRSYLSYSERWKRGERDESMIEIIYHAIYLSVKCQKRKINESNLNQTTKMHFSRLYFNNFSKFVWFFLKRFFFIGKYSF